MGQQCNFLSITFSSHRCSSPLGCGDGHKSVYTASLDNVYGVPIVAKI